MDDRASSRDRGSVMGRGLSPVWHPRFRARVVAACIAVCIGAAPAFALAACDAAPMEGRALHPLDKSDVGEPFDANFLLADADFEDAAFLPGDSVQAFFEKPPYGAPSFLAGYVEKGRRAADLVADASSRHRVSGLWLLARLQRDGALIAARRYPSEAKDTEFVFSYGCSGRLLCDAHFGGLSVQLDALAGDMRRSFAAVRGAGVSVNGFAVGERTATLDNVFVTSANLATAALYALEPVVHGNNGGQEQTWRIYRLYAAHTGYSPSGREPAP